MTGAWRAYRVRQEAMGRCQRSCMVTDEEWSIMLSVKDYLRMIDISDVDGIDAEGDTITLIRKTKHSDSTSNEKERS